MKNFRLPNIGRDIEFDTLYKMNQFEQERVDTFLSLLENILYYRLTPAGKRLFQAVWHVSNRRHFVTRRYLAMQLMRPKGRLLPYDVKLLSQFVTWGLLEEERRARPLRNGMPTGYEIVYILPHNVKWGCKRLAERRRTSTAATDNQTSSSTNSTDNEKLPEIVRWGLRSLKRKL